MRRDTRQLMRRSRSPTANGRIPENSEPLPTRRDRCAPTSPCGCGISARESNGARPGSVCTSEPTRSTGPQRQPAHRLVSATSSIAGRRGPHRRGLSSRSRVWDGSRTSRPTTPPAGCRATYGAWPLTRATCSTSAPSWIRSRDTVPWPSCRVRWSSSDRDRRLRCAVAGTRPIAAQIAKGAPSTTSTGSPNTTARASAAAATMTARPSAGVARQLVLTSPSVAHSLGTPRASWASAPSR